MIHFEYTGWTIRYLWGGEDDLCEYFFPPEKHNFFNAGMESIKYHEDCVKNIFTCG